MLKLKQKISIFLAVAITLLIPGTASFAADLDFSSQAAILADMETGQVLYEKNADIRWSPASTTKIMTAIVALENASLDTEMKASSKAINTIPIDYGIAGIRVGEIMKFDDLLHFVLIISANEASNVIAENISSGIDGFVELMNQKAQQFGLNNTHFTNTYGFDEDNHYSSARDLLITAREAMKIPVFREIVAKRIIPLPDTNLRKSDGWDRWHNESTNKLLKSTSEYYSKVTGIKTGYTGRAGRCLVFSAVNDEGLELVGVLLGAENEEILFREAQSLLEYGFKNYKVQTLASSGEFYGRYDVMDSVDNIPVELQTLGSVSHLLPLSEEKLQTEVYASENLSTPFTAPVTKGQVLGYKTWYYKGEEIGSIQLVAMNDIEKILMAKIRDRFHELTQNNMVRNIAIITGVLIVALLILRIILRSISRRRRYNRRHYRL